MSKKLTYIVLFSFLILSLKGYSQESLCGLEFNHVVKKHNDNRIKNKSLEKSKSVIELPFIDDFAKSVGLPDSSLWIDNYAFVNINYGIDVPSIGIVTLDAINKTGTVYQTTDEHPFSADTLTSKPINLNYPDNNTIFLSFYYQPGGLGDLPEMKDTLILEYYSVDTDSWETVWKVNFDKKDSILIENNILTDVVDTIFGSEDFILNERFHQVIIPVNDNKYLKTGFKFRFINYASLTLVEGTESRSSNADHWNIDFVILNKDRNENDTIIEDVAIIKPQGSLLNTLEAIPCTHWMFAQSEEMEDTLVSVFRNLSSTGKTPPYYFRIVALEGTTSSDIFDKGGQNETPPFTVDTVGRPFVYSFPPIPDLDTMSFQVTAYFTDDDNIDTKLLYNDTTHFHQKFYNYYAYDDGTSENGYGLIGEGTERGMVAMRFETYMEDTLSGIQIYFNQSLDKIQYEYKIHVWNEQSGQPGDIIHTLELKKPTSSDDLNKFTLIPFEKKLVLRNAFYIGWQKINNSDMLNVGYDINRVSNDKLFYNFSGEWKKSDYEGTVMIRPMFGKKIEVITSSNPVKPNKIDFKLYPNPAKDIINIDYNFNSNYTYIIYDSYGRLIKSNSTSANEINISDLSPGMYILNIKTQEAESATRKFIVLP